MQGRSSSAVSDPKTDKHDKCALSLDSVPATCVIGYPIGLMNVACYEFMLKLLVGEWATP